MRLQLADAQLAIAAGDFERARRRLDRAEALKPDEGKIWLYRAMLAAVDDDPQATVTAARRALESPTYERHAYGHEVLALLASSLRRLGRGDEAFARARQALALRPHYVPALELVLRLGRDRLPLGEWPPLIERGEAAAPDNPTWTLFRALGALRTGDVAGAERLFRDLDRAGIGTEAVLGLAACQVRRGARADAAASLDRLVRSTLDPDQRRRFDELRQQAR